MLTVLSSTFLFALDNTIVADVQSPIVERFGEVGKLSWLGVAFVLSGSATIITWYVGLLLGNFLDHGIYNSMLYQGQTFRHLQRKVAIPFLGRPLRGWECPLWCGSEYGRVHRWPSRGRTRGICLTSFPRSRTNGWQGAGMYLGCITLLTLTTSVRQRPNYMALTGISMS